MFVRQCSKPMQANPELTIAQAAEVLGVSVDTVRRRLRRGELHGRQVPTQRGPAWRVRIAEDATVGSTPMQPGLADLVAMLREVTERAERNAAAAAMWQERCRVLQDRLQALPAPAIAPDAPQ